MQDDNSMCSGWIFYHHWIIRAVGVRTHSGVLVRHRIHAQPDGEGGVGEWRVWEILLHLWFGYGSVFRMVYFSIIILGTFNYY